MSELNSPIKISISGEIGSGKSSVTREICSLLDINALSTGSIQRELARSLKMDTLELNLYSEKHPEIDDKIDEYLINLNDKKESFILDSRMAWHFIPSSYKVYLIVDTEIASKRVMLDKARSNSESYTDVENAYASILSRRSSEIRRFESKYNVDISKLENYDLVIDTSYGSPDLLAKVIVNYCCFIQKEEFYPNLWIAPKRLYPTENIRAMASPEAEKVRESISKIGFDHNFPISVICSNEKFILVDGHKRCSAAIINEIPIIPCKLIASSPEEKVIGNISVEQFIDNEINKSWIYDWEDSHSFRFNNYDL